MQAKIDGNVIGYDTQGQGIPLVLMHAFPLHRGMFQPQLAQLSQLARVLTFDVPGMGESSDQSVSMDSIADLAVRLLDEQGIDKAVVGGVSMGGYAAFAFARRHPGRLLGLILANTKPDADTAEAKTGRKQMAEVAIELGASEIAARMLPKLLGPTSLSERPHTVDLIRSMIVSANPRSIASLLEALANRADSTDLLGEIRVPTLVVAGAEDAIIPAAGAEQWSKQIRDSTYVRIPRAGHLSNLEAPEVFNAALETFLRKVAGQR